MCRGDRAREILLFMILSVFVTAACDGPKAQKPVVGAILAESGPASFIGEPERRVLDSLWAEYRRDAPSPPPFQIEFYDSEGNPNRALALFKRLVSNRNLLAVIGPSTSGESIPLAKRADNAGIPLLSLAASRQIVTDSVGEARDWTFKFAQNDNLAAERLTRVMRRKGTRRVALLYVNDPFGNSGAEVFRQQAEFANLSIVIDRSYPPNLDTPEPYFRGINSSVDGVLIWGTARPPMIVRNLKTRGYDGEVYLSHGNASESFVSDAGAASEDVIVVGSRVLLEPRYLDKTNPADRVILHYRSFWQSNFGGQPSHFGGHARDALGALLEVAQRDIEERDLKDQRRMLRDGLETLEQFYGVTGTFRFSGRDHAGLSVEAFETYRIRNGSFVPYGEADD